MWGHACGVWAEAESHSQVKDNIVCVCGGGDRVGMSVCMPCEGGVCVWVCV